MKKVVIQCLSIGLCLSLVLSAVGMTAHALTNDKQNTSEKTSAKATGNTAEDQEITKDETVYVLAHADGTVQKIIVSDWIKNTIGSASLNDTSELTDVENVKGNEIYTMNGENMRVWNAQGNDIYYQGNIEKELPVNLSVTYTLDGKEISPSELAGKSGHVVIRFDYQNNLYEMVKIDSRTEKIYVPFAMLTGLLLDTDRFTNVDVSNGKLIQDGNRIAVVGIAFPGLQSNLNLDKEKLELPAYVEISADVKDFEMTTTMTIATNEVFNELDPDKLDSLGTLTDSLGELTDAMNQLMDGSSQLYDGLCELLEKSGALIDGIDALASGAQNLKSGAADLDAGASQLQQGASSLYNGLNTLAANSSSLNGGARQVFETLLRTANTQIAAAGLSVPTLTIGNYAEVLNQVIASLDENAVYQAALSQVTAAVEANRPTIVAGVTDAVQAQVTTQVTAAVQSAVTEQVTAAVRENVAEQVIPVATNGQMTKEAYDAAVAAGALDEETHNAIEAAIDAQMATEAVQQTIAENVTAQMASDDVQNMISAKVAQQMQTESIHTTIADNVELQVQQAISENMASDAVQSQLAAASEGAASLISLKASLDSYNSFYLGLLSYTNGVASAVSGAGALKNGMDDLKEGTGKLSTGAGALYAGILKIKDGAPALVDGITQLRDGSLKLSDGLKEFNEKGIQKLVEAVDGDLAGVVTRLRATIDVSKDYQTFSGLSDEMDGQVKFIYRTESIGD